MVMPLQLVGYNGEGYTDDRVFICKSHHPIQVGRIVFNATKSIVCIRNPLDVLPSLAALLNTYSHGNKTDFELHSEYPEFWTWFVKKQTRQMKRFWTTLLKECHEDKKNPLYIVRYEDLVLKPKEAYRGLFSFILEEKDLTGTNAERRIDQMVAMGAKATVTYNLKATTGKFNMHEQKYSPQLRQFVQDELADFIYYFGYAKVDDESPTGFFDFGDHLPDRLAKYNGFKIDAQAALDEVCEDGYIAKNVYTANTNGFPLFDPEDDRENILFPAVTHAAKNLGLIKPQKSP